MEYEAMLRRAKELLPDDVVATERFVIPKVKGHIEGQKTIINNFEAIAKHLGRKPAHLLKFLQKELATPGELKKQSVVFGTKLAASRINEKIDAYADVFVTCKTCGKPETKLAKEGSAVIMRCQACGARAAVRSKI
ncbi:MAG: translation initiation factor IF-2 subunit beta [Nitrosarchaeum sp.]|nr:translation initiation factor IF-2 subunit beta [Nitrosarchaeum sp.]